MHSLLSLLFGVSESSEISSGASFHDGDTAPVDSFSQGHLFGNRDPMPVVILISQNVFLHALQVNLWIALNIVFFLSLIKVTCGG